MCRVTLKSPHTLVETFPEFGFCDIKKKNENVVPNFLQILCSKDTTNKCFVAAFLIPLERKILGMSKSTFNIFHSPLQPLKWAVEDVYEVFLLLSWMYALTHSDSEKINSFFKFDSLEVFYWSSFQRRLP